jgi:FkbM family methyltransferase
MPTTTRGMLKLIWDHPANKGRRFSALGKTVAWQAYKRTVGMPFSLSVYDGLKFRCYPDSTEPGRFLYYGGLPDFEEMQFMRRYLRPGDSFIDCGANVGIYTLLAASLVGPEGAVHSFEPTPKSVARLVENVLLNQLTQVTIHTSAVSSSMAEVVFVIGRDTGAGNRMETAEDEGVASVAVVSVPLDDVLVDQQFAMAKFDVEGAEGLALQGARRLLESGNPPVLQLELVERFVRRFGSSVADIVDFLAKCGYDVALYDPATNRLRFSSEFAGATTDILAIHRDSRDAVEERLAAR